jgi:flagellar motor protein MotB
MLEQKVSGILVNAAEEAAKRQFDETSKRMVESEMAALKPQLQGLIERIKQALAALENVSVKVTKKSS